MVEKLAPMVESVMSSFQMYESCTDIWKEAAVDVTPSLLAPNEPHSVEHGSVRHKLKFCLSHTYALFHDNNAYILDDTETTTREKKYAVPISPFK